MLDAATRPTPYNVTMTNADTEYSQALPATCRRFELQNRGAFDMRFAFVTGKVAGSTAPFMTLKAGGWYDSGPINADGVQLITIYVACSNAAQVAEILSWS